MHTHKHTQLPAEIGIDAPHAVTVACWQQCNEVMEPGSGLRDVRLTPSLSLRVSPVTMPRALRIIDALMKLAEQRGFTVSVDTQLNTTLTVLGERVHLHIREKAKRVPHEPTVKELEDKRRSSWSYAPTHDLKPSGVLLASITDSYRYETQWVDGKKKRLEDQIESIVVGVTAIAQKEIERREARRRAEEESAQRAHREYLHRRRREYLDQQMDAWERATRIRAFAVQLEAAQQVSNLDEAAQQRIAAWVEWSRRYADQMDPLLHLDSFASLDSDRLPYVRLL